jgi:hypothetical protein
LTPLPSLAVPAPLATFARQWRRQQMTYPPSKTVFFATLREKHTKRIDI